MATRKKTVRAAAPKAAKTAKPAKAASEPAKPADEDAKPKLSLLKAAIAVLEESEEAMTTKQMIEAAKAKGIWEPGGGKTPEQTLYSAIARDIKKKGEAARFRLASRGHFALVRHEA